MKEMILRDRQVKLNHYKMKLRNYSKRNNKSWTIIGKLKHKMKYWDMKSNKMKLKYQCKERIRMISLKK